MHHLLIYLLYSSVTVVTSASGANVQSNSSTSDPDPEHLTTLFPDLDTSSFDDHTSPPAANDTIERAGLPLEQEPDLLDATKGVANQENDGIEMVASCNSCSIIRTNLTQSNIAVIVNSSLHCGNNITSTIVAL